MAFDDKTVWTVTREKRGYGVVASGRPAEKDSQPDFRGQRQSAYPKNWSQAIDIRPRSIIRTGDVLILGGLPKEKEGNPYAIGGEGRLQILFCRDGKKIRDMKIDSPPVWDSMAASDGSLLIPCVDGSVVSFGK